jgi:hypothetical protein
MDPTVTQWIAAVAAAGSAIAAAVFACFSSRSSRIAAEAARTSADTARTAANAAATNLILKFRDQYASDEMLIDLRNLRAWQNKHAAKFVEEWQNKLAQGDKEALIVDASRRRVTSFFSKIADLHDTNLVPERIKKLLVDFTGLELLDDVVEPLEQALSSDYDNTLFQKLRELRPVQRRKLFLPMNWVIRDPHEPTPAR